MFKKFLMVCVSAFSILATALCAAQALDSDAAVGEIRMLGINDEGSFKLSDLKENALKFKKSLSKEQREQIKAVLAANPPAAEDMTSPPVDKKSVLSLAEIAASNPQKMEQVEERFKSIQAGIEAVLNPEQVAAYEAAFPPSPKEVANKLGNKDKSNATPQAYNHCANAEYYNYYTYYYAYYSYAYAVNYAAAYGWALEDLAYDLYYQAYLAYLYSYYALAYYGGSNYRTYAYYAYVYDLYAIPTAYAVLNYAYDPHYTRSGNSNAYYAYFYAYYARVYGPYGQTNAYYCAYY